MYGNSLGNSGITQLTNYEQALKHYESVVPIRGHGSNAGTKPLGMRNKPQFQIVMDTSDAVSCRLYKTDVITFRPDGFIRFRTDRYTTSTTANFIAQVLGTPCSKFDNRLILAVNGGAYTVNEMLVLRSEGGAYKVWRCEPDIVHTIDRKTMNAIRKDMREFINYVSGVMKMQEGKLSPDEYDEGLKPLAGTLGATLRTQVPRITIDSWSHSHTQTSALIDKFLSLVRSGDAGNWYLSFLWLVHSSSHTWSSQVVHYVYNEVMDTLNDILIAANPHVLKAVKVDAGVVKVDRYKKFRPFKEEQ